MLDRFSERARKVVALARTAAMDLQHEYIGTEHILLGILNEGTGNALAALVVMEVDPSSIRAELERVLRPGAFAGKADDLVFTPRAKKAMELAEDEGERLGHVRVGTEHLLLGLIREDKGIAARALHNADVTLGAARASVVEVVGGMNFTVVPYLEPVRSGPLPPGVIPMAPSGPAAFRVPERKEPLRPEPVRQEPVRQEAPRLEPNPRTAAPAPAPTVNWTALVVLTDPADQAREEPVGAVRVVWESAGSPGADWLPCDGRRADPAANPALAALLRTQRDGDSEDVHVPDFRGLRIAAGRPAPNAPRFASSALFGQGNNSAAIRFWIKAR